MNIYVCQDGVREIRTREVDAGKVYPGKVCAREIGAAKDNPRANDEPVSRNIPHGEAGGGGTYEISGNDPGEIRGSTA